MTSENLKLNHTAEQGLDIIKDTLADEQAKFTVVDSVIVHSFLEMVAQGQITNLDTLITIIKQEMTDDHQFTINESFIKNSHVDFEAIVDAYVVLTDRDKRDILDVVGTLESVLRIASVVGLLTVVSDILSQNPEIYNHGSLTLVSYISWLVISNFYNTTHNRVASNVKNVFQGKSK